MDRKGKTLDGIFEDYTKAMEGATTRAQVLKEKSRYLGKKGQLSEVLASLGRASSEERATLGPRANKLKVEMNRLFVEKLSVLEREEVDRKLAEERVDISLTDSVMAQGLRHGGMHPVSKIQREIEDIFLSMGFEVLDGPHVEDEFHNFEALNIPSDHPARDMQDTFWFPDGKHLLRTHTSTIQVRGMLARKPPFSFVAPGKVFRCERTDAGHEMVFHQLEGMMVDRGLAVSHLIYFMNTLLEEVFQKKINTRLRPGFFPFVEPGLELDMECQVCRKKGCSVCKQTGWLELLPCGMVHPRVLESGGIDAKAHSGFAFGLGLDRLVMMRYGIDDIRHMHSGDLRFVEQFRDF